jgi:hypothetical protein
MNQLTTTAKVKEYMGITDSGSDTLIASLIKGVSAFIGSYCGGRKFESADYVETYDTQNGRHKIFLKQIPVTEVTTVEYRAGTPSTPIWNTYNVDSYLPYLNEGYIYFYSALPRVAQGLRISYTAGYLIDFDHEDDTTKHTLPFDLTMAANEMIGNILNTRKAAGITNETTEGQSITYDFKRAMTDSVKNTLDTYKLFRIAS